MSLTVFLIVLCAAFLHASWNIIVKGGGNKLFEMAINALGGGLSGLLLLAFLPAPARESWPLLALSCICRLFYMPSLAAAYRHGDLSVSYAIMRGTAPILTAFALLCFGVAINLYGWLGIFLLCSGVLLLGLHGGGASGKTTFLALRTSVVIMCYTLADGFGARLSGNGLSYACWLFFFNIFPIQIYILLRHREEYLAYPAKRFLMGLFGGLCSFLSYGAAIWAMTQAPIALVGALRESSVIFGLILAVIFLKEQLTFRKALAIALVCAGAIGCRLG